MRQSERGEHGINGQLAKSIPSLPSATARENMPNLLIHFRNERTQRSVHGQRDDFISQLRSRENDILKLAATKCGQPTAEFFQSEVCGDYYTRGSYNATFFIRLANGQKCVLRIPLRPCLAYCPHRKLECEIATMQHLSNCTTIPVPKVMAYRIEKADDPLSTFAILEHIDGKRLSPAELDNTPSENRLELYKSLADVYIQLRRQEFPSIGKLTKGVDRVCVGEKTASIMMNMMQLEGLDPIHIQNSYHDESGLLKSANIYTKMLLSIGYSAFLKSPNAVMVDMGLENLHHHFLFSKYVETWIEPGLDEGPFVLIHGDLHLSNMVVDDDLRLVGVLDWEWSRVVPVQYFSPPLWLSNRNEVQLAYPISWECYCVTEFAKFLRVVKSREEDMYQNNLLYDEWTRKMTDRAGPLVANALENWTDVDWFIFQRSFDQDPSLKETALEAFAADDPLRTQLAEMKEHDCRIYEKDLELLVESDKNGQNSLSATIPQTLAWRAYLQNIPISAGALGATIAASAVAVAIWSRWQPSPSR